MIIDVPVHDVEARALADRWIGDGFALESANRASRVLSMRASSMEGTSVVSQGYLAAHAIYIYRMYPLHTAHEPQRLISIKAFPSPRRSTGG
jgi:hypothetical protein